MQSPLTYYIVFKELKKFRKFIKFRYVCVKIVLVRGLMLNVLY